MYCQTGFTGQLVKCGKPSMCVIGVGQIADFVARLVDTVSAVIIVLTGKIKNITAPE
jgi:hypothetical protein